MKLIPRSRLLLLAGLAWTSFVAISALVVWRWDKTGHALDPHLIGLSAFAGLSLLGGLLGLFALNAILQRRLDLITHAVRAVRTHVDFSGRVKDNGPAEFQELASEINGLLNTLQRIHEHLQGMNARLENLVAERTAEVEASKQALAEDAARRIQIERSNAERERIYRTINELSPTGIMLEAEDGTILEVNHSFCNLLGYPREELIGRSVFFFTLPEDADRIRANLKQLLAGETLFHEVRNIRKDGRRCDVELRERAITLPSGEQRIIVIANDVTERKAREEQLRKSEKRYHALFNTLITGFALHEIVVNDTGEPVDYIFIDINPAFTVMTGKRREEVIGRRVTEVFPGIEPEWIRRYGEVALTGRPSAFESYSGPLNKYFSVIAYSPERGQFAVNFLDITERKRAERQLQLQGAALESAVNGIMIVNREGIITWVNKALTRLTGYAREELEGQSPRIFKSGRHGADFYRDLWNTVLAGRMWRGELVNRRKNGRLYLEDMTITPVLDERGAPAYFVAIKQDISEQRDLQQQLQQAQKMDMIGRLAGGIAHDFNNLLQAITGFSHLLLESMGPTSPYRSDVLEIDRAAQRASELTRQLLAFSRRQMIEPRAIDLNALVESTEKMLQRLIGEDIQLELDLEPNLDSVRADPGQIEQVLVNLTVNARDAMASGGRLTVSTRSIVLLKEDALLTPDVRYGRFVILALTDTGEGMTPDVLEHIFEPFFTTKGPGRGTGLGLSVVYGIVQQHEGMIRVYSEPGQGTTFRIYLPVSETAEITADVDEAGLAPTLPRGNGERILLVEDEPGVRDFALSALRQYGYDPHAATSCAEAKALFAQESGRFDLVFTDVVLSDETGLDLAAALMEQKPGLRVLFTSGYMDEKSRWPIIRDRGYPFLQKPYPLERLLVTLREVLHQPAPPPA